MGTRRFRDLRGCRHAPSYPKGASLHWTGWQAAWCGPASCWALPARDQSRGGPQRVGGRRGPRFTQFQGSYEAGSGLKGGDLPARSGTAPSRPRLAPKAVGAHLGLSETHCRSLSTAADLAAQALRESFKVGTSRLHVLVQQTLRSAPPALTGAPGGRRLSASKAQLHPVDSYVLQHAL